MAWNRGVEDSAAFREQLWEMWAHIHQIGEFWKLVSILNGDQSYENLAYAWLEAATFERLSRDASTLALYNIL